MTLDTYENLGQDAAELIRNAINQGADGIAAPNWVPDAQDEAYRGCDRSRDSDHTLQCRRVRKGRLNSALSIMWATRSIPQGWQPANISAAAQAKHVVCVNTVPGAANLEARCKGIHDGVTAAGFKSVQLPLPANNFGDKIAVTEALKAELLRDPTIDALVTMGNQDADSAALAIQQAVRTGSGEARDV